MIVTDLWTGNFPLEKCIRGLKDLGTEEYFLLQCIEKMEMPGINLEVMKNTLQSSMERYRRFFVKEGFSIETDVVIGKTCEEINKNALAKKCSFMVFGSYRHTRTYELLLGSLANETICHQVMPVLLIHIMPADRQFGFVSQEKYNFLSHVMFPTDFSENAEYAILYLKKLVGRGPGRITLLHVQNKTFISPHLTHRLEEFNRIDVQRLEKIRKEFLGRKADVDIKIIYGHPVKEIVNLAKEMQVSLIVMGRQGKGFLNESFIGSISQNVARCSESPVLLIPMPDRDINNPTSSVFKEA